MTIRSRIAAAVVYSFALLASALEMPPVFSDHMVLQRGKQAPVWGNAEAGAEVVVSFANQEKKTKADPSGCWRVSLDAMEATAAGAALEVRESRQAQIAKLRFQDVIVGEVWFCSGQSNMKFMLKQATGGTDAIKASGNESLRLLNFNGSLRPGVSSADYFSTKGWQVSSPQSSADFSAVAWFFGQKLQRDLGVPVGLIGNAVGGAPIEAFLPGKTIADDADLKARCANWLENPAYPRWCRERAKQELAKLRGSIFHPYGPASLYEAGFAPLQPFAIRGVLWYQGESNATDTPESPALDTAPYEKMFKLLVDDWRRGWNNSKLPVYFVQLPRLNRDWGRFREMQARLATETPDCGMVTTLDVGHPTDVHPPNKRPVGERLAGLAMTNIYGRVNQPPPKQ